MDTERVIAATDAARRAGVVRRSLQYWLDRHGHKRIPLAGRRWGCTESALRAYMADRARRAALRAARDAAAEVYRERVAQLDAEAKR